MTVIAHSPRDNKVRSWTCCRKYVQLWRVPKARARAGTNVVGDLVNAARVEAKAQSLQVPLGPGSHLAADPPEFLALGKVAASTAVSRAAGGRPVLISRPT